MDLRGAVRYCGGEPRPSPLQQAEEGIFNFTTINVTCMKFSFVLIVLCFCTAINAQESSSWRIYHNKKLLLFAKEESEAKNIVKIKTAELKKSGQLLIDFHEGEENKDWVRTFAIFNEKDSMVFEKKSQATIKIPNTTLIKISAGQSQIKIYTWSLPSNPKLASTIRIRRVHLCTIKFE